MPYLRFRFHHSSHCSWRKRGVSLIMTFGVTFVVMVFAVFLLSSVLSSLERTADIERSNEIFYATEAGLEAAFFHANVRGMGVHFCDDDSDNCISEETDTSQTITLDDGTNVTWAIKGRADSVTGNLRPHEYIEIPLYWDGAGNPSEAENSKKAEDFSVVFDIPDPDNDYYGSSAEEVLIDWTLRGENTGGERLSFYPFTQNKTDPCADSDATFVCDDEEEFNFNTSDNNESKQGTPVPETAGLENTNDFMQSYWEKAVFSFQSVLDYPDGVGGIPYTIKYTGPDNIDGLPTPNYTAFAKVSGDGFQRETAVRVPHVKKRGVFSYVVFD